MPLPKILKNIAGFLTVYTLLLFYKYLVITNGNVSKKNREIRDCHLTVSDSLNF